MVEILNVLCYCSHQMLARPKESWRDGDKAPITYIIGEQKSYRCEWKRSKKEIKVIKLCLAKHLCEWRNATVHTTWHTSPDTHNNRPYGCKKKSARVRNGHNLKEKTLFSSCTSIDRSNVISYKQDQQITVHQRFPLDFTSSLFIRNAKTKWNSIQSNDFSLL